MDETFLSFERSRGWRPHSRPTLAALPVGCPEAATSPHCPTFYYVHKKNVSGIKSLFMCSSVSNETSHSVYPLKGSHAKHSVSFIFFYRLFHLFVHTLLIIEFLWLLSFWTLCVYYCLGTNRFYFKHWKLLKLYVLRVCFCGRFLFVGMFCGCRYELTTRE